jgi:hypothetical protein
MVKKFEFLLKNHSKLKNLIKINKIFLCNNITI